MHPVLSRWHDAHNGLSAIGTELESLVKHQFVIEANAYNSVYGKLLPIYETTWNYTKINEDGRVEAWCWGSWGGEDYLLWERGLETIEGDQELMDLFQQRFTLQKQYQDAEAARKKEAKRKKLLEQLEELDK